MDKKSIIEKALLDLQRKSLNTPAVKAHFLGSEKHCGCHDIVFEYSNGRRNNLLDYSMSFGKSCYLLVDQYLNQ